MHKSLPAGAIALALVLPLSATAADPPNEIQGLRQDIDALRSGYEARLQALEQRLHATEAAAAPLVSTAVAPGAPPGAGTFNPALSLILSGLYARTSQDPAKYAITGFQLPTAAGAGPGARGFSLTESELGLAASIDPWLQGAANISLHPDDTVSVEEAFIQTTSLGAGLTLKAGRFFSGVGYLNSQHSHTWDFVDNPLAYQALLGTQYGDDGVQLHWLAPTELFLETGVELARGRSYPGGDNSRNGAGMVALTTHAGGDIGSDSSWRAGVSVLNAQASDQSMQGVDPTGAPVESSFTGRTRVWVADAVWKWAPGGNATRTNFKLQGEYLRSNRVGTLAFDPAHLNSTGSYQSVQSGWYVQGIYQFMPSWRIGLRAESLDPGTPDYGSNASLYAQGDYHPQKNSLMLDFSPSEFSRVRLQFAQDHSRQGASDNQVFLQYQMSLGAHGAHAY